jgi:hypothetical protein
MTRSIYVFNPPPGWLVPTDGWVPPEGWTPDPGWPPAPPNWAFWVTAPPPAVGVPARVSPPAVDPQPVPSNSVPPPAAGSPETDRTEPASIDSHARTRLLEDRIGELEAELNQLRATPAPGADTVDLDDERVLQEVGIYRYHHPLENAAQYKDQLSALSEEIKTMVKQGEAVLASDMFTFNNSLAQGRKMTREFSKLMLRAYNAEADNCVRSLRAGNVVTAKKRLDASVAAIAKLGSMMEMRVSPEYHDLRRKELLRNAV